MYISDFLYLENSELNSQQNVYFGFFILGKITEWRCFVTYLWNDS